MRNLPSGPVSRAPESTGTLRCSGMTSPSPASWTASCDRPEPLPAGHGRRPSPPPSRFSASSLSPAALARGWCAAACLLVAALALLLGAGAAEAQTPTSVKLVGNTTLGGGISYPDFTEDCAFQ